MKSFNFIKKVLLSVLESNIWLTDVKKNALAHSHTHTYLRVPQFKHSVGKKYC